MEKATVKIEASTQMAETPQGVWTEFAELRSKVSSPAAAAQLWRQLLSDDERQQLGEDLDAAYERFGDTIGMWIKLHPTSVGRAIVDLGYRLNFIASTDRERYEKLLALESPRFESASERPSWNRVRGELTFRGDVIRTVRIGIATTMLKILDTFETEGWPEQIADPLEPTRDKQRLRETVATLNDGLSGIRFRSDGTGAGILWEVR